MTDNKQIVINKNLHTTIKGYCASNENKIKEFAEAALEFAIDNKMTIDQLREKQYRDSVASVASGGNMIRYGKKNEEKIPDLNKITEEKTDDDDGW